MRRNLPILTVLATIALSIVSALAQVKPPVIPQDDTVRVTTSSVQIEAVVTDKSGRHIEGLTAADFQILDEGKRQRIDYFGVVRGSRLLSKSGSAAETNNAGNQSQTTDSPLTRPYQGRHIALVFDDLNLSSENFLRSRQSLANFINTKLTDNDMVALTSTGGSLGSLQQFTNDKQRLLSALNRIAAQSTLTQKIGAQRFNMTVAEAVRIDSGDLTTLQKVKLRVAQEEMAAPSGTIIEQTAGRPGVRDVAAEGRGDALDSAIRGAARSMVAQVGQATRNNLTTIENLFRGMAELPGRKIVVLLTESLPATTNSDETSHKIVQLIELARRSGVSVYALDAAGLRASNITASERVTSTSAFIRDTSPEMSFSDFEKLGAARALVAGTGGDLISNTNDLSGGLERAMEDSGSYYVLGFRPGVLDNKFHHLSITLNGKTGVVIRARRGYLAVNQETVRGTDAELLDALLRSPVPKIDLPLEVVANVVPVRGEQSVFMGLHVGRNYLTLPAANAADQSASYEIVSYVFAAGLDKPVGALVTTASYDLAKDPAARQKLKTEGLVTVKEFTQLPPGSYQIRAVVREKSTGAVGSNYQFFEVPDVKNAKLPSVSSLVLTPSGQTGFRGHNTFKRGSEIEMRYVLYNLPKDNSALTQQVKLIDSQGQVLMDSALALATTSSASGQFPQGTRLNVPAVRGRYALIVGLRGGKGRVDIERRADFVVE